MQLLRLLDPEGCSARRQHQIIRRVYVSKVNIYPSYHRMYMSIIIIILYYIGYRFSVMILKIYKYCARYARALLVHRKKFVSHKE